MDLLSRHSVGLSRMWQLEADSEPRWTSCWNSTNIARRTNRDALWLDQTMIPQLLRIWWQPLLVQWLFIHLSQITSLASPWPTVSTLLRGQTVAILALSAHQMSHAESRSNCPSGSTRAYCSLLYTDNWVLLHASEPCWQTTTHIHLTWYWQQAD